MLTISNISKSYGSNVLFEGTSFSINSGDRIGLVGRNGHGKSTLLRILSGAEEADEGLVRAPRDYKIGFLEQHLDFKSKTILDFACEGLDQNYVDVLSYQAKAVLLGLGFNEEQFSEPAEKLSGGFQVRLNLAKLLVSEPNLLLLDEPTNYLDILSMRWLSRFLIDWNGEVIFITHDRNFMDEVATHILGIHRQKIIKLQGDTDNYYQFVQNEDELYEKNRVTQQKRREQTEAFVTRFRAQASKAKAVQSRIKALEKEEKLEELSDINALDFKFPYLEFKGKWSIHAKNLSFGYENTQNLLIDNLSFSLRAGERVGIIGKNGKGKSTLLKLLAQELRPKSGSVELSSNSTIQYFGQTNVDRLNPSATIEEELQSVDPLMSRTVVRTIAGLMMFSGDLAEKKIKVLSGGEKARVLLGKLLLQPGNLLLLDEPTNHLDLESNEALLNAINTYSGTVVIVTHNEKFLNELAQKLIIYDRNQVEFFEGNYQDFLRDRGWEDEGGPTKASNTGNTEKLSKKELRKMKANSNSRRNQELKPLANQMKKIEIEIIGLEESVAKETAELIEITKHGFNDNAAKLTRSINQNKSKIEELFAELEEVSEKHAALEHGNADFSRQKDNR